MRKIEQAIKQGNAGGDSASASLANSDSCPEPPPDITQAVHLIEIIARFQTL